MIIYQRFFLSIILFASVQCWAVDTEKVYKYHQRDVEAREHLIRKANDGDLEAMYRVGYGYYKGQYPARKKDYALAYDYLMMAADKNHARSAFWLGKLFEDKKTGRDSLKNAIISYTHASGLKSWDGTMHLAAIFWNGKGVEQDYTVAYALNQAAAPLAPSVSYATINNRANLEKVFTPEQLMAAKHLGKQLAQSDNHFVTINNYLKLYGKQIFHELILVFRIVREK